MEAIDLRSDTVTLPTNAMRQAMAIAPLGDDVFEEDPTTIKLERTVAELTGHESALLVPSGTMGNLVGILTHCGRGDEVILGDKSHTTLYEAGGISALGGIHPHPLANQPDGTLDPAQIEAAIAPDNVHFPHTRLISLENTHNACGGRVLTLDYMNLVADLAAKHQLKVHLDGARIFNAAVALNIEIKELTGRMDSVSVCLSKGLAAPVGSVLCGPQAFIRKARRTRKIVGGGMRQCGVLAAAGLVALDHMVERLAEDHENAQTLAQGLANMNGIEIDPNTVQTNIVFFNLSRDDMTAQQLVDQLTAEGIKILALGPSRLRAVTHYGISAKDIERLLSVISKLLG
jgi:threonine aldolase